MTPTGELERTLRQIISDVGAIQADFPAAADLYDELGLDSFRVVEIFVEIEKQLGVRLTEDDYVAVRTLGAMTDAVARA